MPLSPNTRLGRYEIRSWLGAGGMGEVYLAYDTSLRRQVAIKLLPVEFTQNQVRLRRFEREAYAASSLNHPNILTIYEIGQADGIHFIATEFIDGVTLRRHVKNTPLKLTEVLGITVQIATALAAAHAAGIVHRDIKPENIMVRRDGFAKVLDFGAAKLTEAEVAVVEAEAETKPLPLTEPEGTVGTITYMSPEQARGKDIDARTDIWSLGIVLYELVAGCLPFAASTPSEVLVSIIGEGEPPPLARFSRDVPDELERIVSKALRKNKEERYQVIKDMALDLGSLKHRLEFDAEVRRSSTGSMPARTLGGRAAGSTSSSARATTSKLQLSNTLKGHKVAALSLALSVVVVLASISYFYFLRGTPARISAVAVLPFFNVGGDPNMEYLADGITESLIGSVSQLPDLAVIARSSVFRYKGREIDPQAVGRELGVGAVLIGRIVQRGDSLSIDAELVDVSNNHRIWGDQYNRPLSDLLAVQTDISRDISEKLRLTLTSEEQRKVTKHYTENVEAYQLYLKGRYYWNKRTGEDIKKSIDLFQQAIAKDTGYALAYAGLADSYHVLWVYSDVPFAEALLKAKAAALRALEIDDTLAEAHVSLASIKSDDEWDFAAAEVEFKRGIELNANYATARQWYAQFLSPLARHQEALAEIKKAQELDPFSLIINAVVGDTLVKARQYDQAIEQLRKTIDMDKNFPPAHQYLANAYLGKGMYLEAIAERQVAVVLSGKKDAAAAAAQAETLKTAYGTAGVNGYWQKQLDLVNEDMKHQHPSPYFVASIHAQLGEKEQSIEWLQKALKERDADVVYLRVDPQFDLLRSDSRVINLMKQIGLTN